MDVIALVVIAFVVLAVIGGLVALAVSRVRARPRAEDGYIPPGPAHDPQVRPAPTTGVRGDIAGPGAGV